MVIAPSICCWFAFAMMPPAEGPGSPEVVTRTGTVRPAAEALNAAGIPADTGPLDGQFVLVGDDGSIAPLISDQASRALFLDERLRGRPVELSARLYPGVPYLQVLTIQVEHEGRMRTPEYYCDVCTISVRYPQACPCCQGEMEFRMKPEAP